MKQISMIMLCLFTLLCMCGCGNSNLTKDFTLAYIKREREKTGSGSQKVSPLILENDIIILPTNSKFLEEHNLQDYLKFYDYETGEVVQDISYNVNFSNTKAGIYDLNIRGKYDDKIGNTTIKIQYVESCSGKCVIDTTNWRFELSGDIEYGSYWLNNILKVKVAMSPKESAFETNMKIEKYETINDGFIYLYYKEYSLYTKEVATGYSYDDNALFQYYSLNETKENMYIQFPYIPYLNDSEAFIDFYDKVTKEHHFYFVN